MCLGSTRFVNNDEAVLAREGYGEQSQGVMYADRINPLKHDEAGADVKAAWVSTKLLCAAHCFLVFRLADDLPITSSLIGRCPASQPQKKSKAIPSITAGASPHGN
jgi:hypothetical protein